MEDFDPAEEEQKVETKDEDIKEEEGDLVGLRNMNSGLYLIVLWCIISQMAFFFPRLFKVCFFFFFHTVTRFLVNNTEILQDSELYLKIIIIMMIIK